MSLNLMVCDVCVGSNLMCFLVGPTRAWES